MRCDSVHGPLPSTLCYGCVTFGHNFLRGNLPGSFRYTSRTGPITRFARSCKQANSLPYAELHLSCGPVCVIFAVVLPGSV
jgi:hypothetical protein